MPLSPPPLLCVVGPTASGKTALAVELALRFGGEVVSCDSMQIYRGMDIGTAKPTPEERRGVPHHMMDCASPFEPWSAGVYAREAERCIEGIQSRGRLPVVCGGSGLWLRALTEGLNDIPAVGNSVPSVPDADAYTRLAEVDPETAARLKPGDSQRVRRALTVFDATGRPLSDYHKNKPEPRYRALCLGLGWERGVLYARIGARAGEMLAQGLVGETDGLLREGLSPDAPPLRAIGYREAVAFLQQSGESKDMDALREAIAQSTRRYAKRQMTWFNHQTEVLWADPSQEKFFEICAKFVEKGFSV